jgi:polysaccharide biosynthesis protein PelE
MTTKYTQALLFSSLFLLSGTAFLFLLQGNAAIAVLLHAGSSMLAFWCARRFVPLRLLGILTLFAGVFGVLATALGLLLKPLLQNEDSQQNFGEWLEQFFEPEHRSVALYRRLQAGQEDATDKSRLQSYQDVMLHGHTMQKREVLNQLTAHYVPAFAPILNMALQDSENSIRVHAATALARLEQQYTQQILSVLKRQRQHPDDVLLLLELAILYDDYAYCGVIDQLRAREMQGEARDLFEKAALRSDLLPLAQQEALFHRLGRLYIRTKQPQRAKELLQQVLLEKSVIPASMMLWYWESLYASGDLAELRTACAALQYSFKKDSLQYQRAAALVDFWRSAPSIKEAA